LGRSGAKESAIQSPGSVLAKKIPVDLRDHNFGQRRVELGIAPIEVIGAGFAIFALSSFPPTQRFGLVVLAGTVIDILANLFVLPVLAGAEFGNRLAHAK
jgi:hypothetical protein